MYVRERTRSRKKQKAYCIQVASPDEETVLRQTSEGTSFHSLLFRRSSSGGDHGRGETADEDRSEDSVSTPKETGSRSDVSGRRGRRIHVEDREPAGEVVTCQTKTTLIIIIRARSSVGPPSSRGAPTSFGGPPLLRIQDLGERLITTSPTALGEQRTLADRTDVRVVHGDAT